MSIPAHSCKHADGSPCHCGAEKLLYRAAVIESDYLFANRSEIQIRHGEEIYRLRITRNGKLILNK